MKKKEKEKRKKGRKKKGGSGYEKQGYTLKETGAKEFP